MFTLEGILSYLDARCVTRCSRLTKVVNRPEVEVNNLTIKNR